MKLLSFLFPQVLDVSPSKLNREIKIVESFGKKTLLAGGVPQSGGEYIFMWEKVIGTLLSEGEKINSCLVLGVGGGSVIWILRKRYPEVKITGIEIDPAVVAASKKYFKLKSSPDLKIIIADAIEWVNQQKGKKHFDLIVVDLFLGRLNPQESREMDFLKNIDKLRAKDGMIIYNSHFTPGRTEELEKLFKGCKSIFTKVREVFSYPFNRVLLLK